MFNVVLVYIKKYWQKGILFYPVFFYIFDSRLPSTAHELKFTLKHRPLSNLVFQESYLKNFKIFFFPLESFVFIGMQWAIQCIKFITKQDTFPCVWVPLQAFVIFRQALLSFTFVLQYCRVKITKLLSNISNQQKHANTKNNSSDEGNLDTLFTCLQYVNSQNTHVNDAAKIVKLYRIKL